MDLQLRESEVNMIHSAFKSAEGEFGIARMLNDISIVFENGRFGRALHVIAMDEKESKSFLQLATIGIMLIHLVSKEEKEQRKERAKESYIRAITF